MKPEVQRARLRPATRYALLLAVIAGTGGGTILLLDVLDPPLPVLREPELQPDRCHCSRTLYYYDMAPFVRERVWCDGVEVLELSEHHWQRVR